MEKTVGEKNSIRKGKVLRGITEGKFPEMQQTIENH